MTEPSPCHLCVTHSPLVTLVFKAAMRHHGVDPDSIRSIARRGVPFPGAGLCLDELSDELEACFRKGHRRGYRAARQQVADTLRGLTDGRPFQAYVPHANKMIYQEIITLPECAGYAFLEEGFSSMAWNNWPNPRSAWFKVLRNHLRTWWIAPRYRFTRPIFDHSLPNYRAAYAISGQAFRGIPGRTDVAAQVPPLPVGNPPGATYLILDAAYLHHGIRWDDYENALVAAVRALAPATGQVFVKFHFADAAAPRKFESIRQRLDGCGPAPPRLLGADFPVEENLTHHDVLVSAFSSLGYYAALMGARVRCFAGEIKGVRLDSWTAAGRLPADFSRVVGW